MGKKKKKKAQKRLKKSLWKDRAIVTGIIVAIAAGFWQFILPRIWPEKSPSSEIKVAPIQYESRGLPLLEIIKQIEGKTNYDVIATKEVKEFKVYGRFEGDDWVHILKKVINAHDEQLKLNLDEKNKEIIITLRHKLGDVL